LNYSDLQIGLVEWLRDFWDKTIFFDLETYVPCYPEKMLTNERILSIAFSRRVNGDYCQKEGIEYNTLILRDDTDEEELSLLRDFNNVLERFRLSRADACVLGVIGYGIRGYDTPLLSMKKRYYRNYCEQRGSKLEGIWNVVDMNESTIHVDLYHFFKFFKHLGLETLKFSQIVNFYSSTCPELPLMKTKLVVSEDPDKKGDELYKLWKYDRKRFEEYALGDVFNLQIITEKLIRDNYKVPRR